MRSAFVRTQNSILEASYTNIFFLFAAGSESDRLVDCGAMYNAKYLTTGPKAMRVGSMDYTAYCDHLGWTTVVNRGPYPGYSDVS